MIISTITVASVKRVASNLLKIYIFEFAIDLSTGLLGQTFYVYASVL